jgi:hypothetical protein
MLETQLRESQLTLKVDVMRLHELFIELIHQHTQLFEEDSVLPRSPRFVCSSYPRESCFFHSHFCCFEPFRCCLTVQ